MYYDLFGLDKYLVLVVAQPYSKVKAEKELSQRFVKFYSSKLKIRVENYEV